MRTFCHPHNHKQAATRQSPGPRRTPAPTHPRANVDHDQRFTTSDRVEDAHLLSSSTSEPQRARRRVREECQRVHSRANVDHEQRLAARDRVEDTHLPHRDLDAPQASRGAPVAGSTKNPAHSPIHLLADVNHEQRTASLRVPHANRPIPDPVATRSAPVAGSTKVTRAFTSAECPSGSASIAAPLAAGFQTLVSFAPIAHEPRLARRRVREGCQSLHFVCVSLEHDQRLAARDRVEDAHLVIVPLDPQASRSAPVARSLNATSAFT